MIRFTELYNDYLQGKSIRDTTTEQVNAVPLPVFACFNFLADVLTGEGRTPNQEIAELFADRLASYFPEMRLATIHVLHSSIMNGSADIKPMSVGGIVRALNRLYDNGPRLDNTQGIRWPEELQHESDYLDRFPDHNGLHAEPVSLDGFLAMHRPGTFQNLENFRSWFVRFQAEIEAEENANPENAVFSSKIKRLFKANGNTLPIT